MYYGLVWPMETSTVFQRPLTVPLHSPNGRQIVCRLGCARGLWNSPLGWYEVIEVGRLSHVLQSHDDSTHSKTKAEMGVFLHLLRQNVLAAFKHIYFNNTRGFISYYCKVQLHNKRGISTIKLKWPWARFGSSSSWFGIDKWSDHFE